MGLSKLHTLLLLFVLLLLQTKAQNHRSIDSLNKTIDSSSNSKLKADTYLKLLFEYTYIDNKKAYEYGNKSLQISKETNYTNGVIEALNALAMLDKSDGHYSKAFSKLKQAIEISEKTNDISENAKTYQNIGDVYSQLQDYEKAIINYEKAYEISLSENSYEKTIIYLSRIANRHMDIGNFRNDTAHIYTAIEIYKKALQIAEKNKDKKKITTMHINLADAHNILGDKDKNKQTFFHALDFSLRSLKLSRENNFPDLEALSFLNIGETYEKLNNLNKAIHYYEEALKKYQEEKNNNWILNTNLFLAHAYYKLNNFNKAVEHCLAVKKLAEQSHIKNSLMNCFLLLSDIHKSKNELQKSFDYYKNYTLYKDSLADEQNAITTARLQTELDLERKNKEIELLKQNAEIQEQKIKTQTVQKRLLITAIALVVILLGFVLYRYKENKKIQQKIVAAKNFAEQAKAIQEQFIANTSHEIRTPMNGIIGMTDLLNDTKLSIEQKEYLGIIKESSNNLLAIVNDLLDLSKINSGKMAFESKAFQLSEILKNVTASLKNKAEEKNLKVIVETDSRINPVLMGDDIRLTQILLNLISNAIKFTEKGEIKISTKLIHDSTYYSQLEFTVADTGIGIPNDKLNDVFNSFTQVDSNINRKHGGTGLGLSIVKQLVEGQGGTITVKSEINKGSVFTFNLNFYKGDKENETRKIVQINSLEKNKIVTILVVDDNKINQQVASLTLRKLKFNVLIADSAKEAFDILKNKTIDIILMDVTMPEMDGFEATHHIRNKFDSPKNNIPIIAMTASALVGDREKCLAEGMNDYISKPFNAEELYLKIQKFLPSDKTNTIDLSLILEKAEGDNEYLKDIIESYILEMPKYLNELTDSIQKNDIIQVAAHAHKMKSPAALMGANELKEVLSELEKKGLEGITNFDYTSFGEKATLLCEKSIEELRKKLENL